MKRLKIVTLATVAAVLLTTASAFAWGFAVHAYVADQIGKQDGDPNINEIYGSTLPDLFNYAFAMPPGLFEPTCDSETLFAITHTANFTGVVEQKNTGLAKRLAVGFYSHNQVGGADFTAHENSAVAGTSGYVIEKAHTLQNMLESAPPEVLPPPLSAVLPGISQEDSHQLYHSVVEYSVDLLLKEHVPEVGPLMMDGASFWSVGYLPPVLTDAFTDDVADSCFDGDPLQAAAYISLVEMVHRQGVFDEGSILTLPPEQARYYTAKRLAVLAIMYLGYSLDPNDINYMNPEPLTELAEAYLQVGMWLCLDDYLNDVEATVDMVRDNMADAGIIKYEKEK